jgi:GNAT superfamily N-acetyltransferase
MTPRTWIKPPADLYGRQDFGQERELQRDLPDGFDESLNDPPTPDEMRPPTGSFLVIYDRDVPVGCGGLRRLSVEVGGDQENVDRPERRSEGHGRTLLRALEAAAVSLGFRELRLDTSRPLAAARRLYFSAGYLDIPSYNSDLYADYWMSKSIGQSG